MALVTTTWLVRTLLCIQAGIWNNQALDGLISNDVRIDDLIHICRRDATIPDCIRIHHHIGAMLALVQAARLISADCTLDSTLCQLDLEHALEFSIACRIATTARIACRPLVAAHKDMSLELRHVSRSSTDQSFKNS